jgi:hypothetical protein
MKQHPNVKQNRKVLRSNINDGGVLRILVEPFQNLGIIVVTVISSLVATAVLAGLNQLDILGWFQVYLSYHK